MITGTSPSTDLDEVEVLAYYVVATRLDGTAEDSRIVRIDHPARSAVISGLRNGVGFEFTVYAATTDGVGTSEAVRARPTNGVDGEVAGLIVEFTPETAITEGQQQVPGEAAIDQVDLTVTSEISDGMHLVELSEPVSLDEAEVIAAELQADPKVTWAEPDQFVFTAAVGSEDATPIDAGSAEASVPVPDDPLYSPDQWNLWGTYGIGIGDGPNDMTDAFAQGQGSGTVVAVIDTGVTAHPDLDAQLVTGYDFVSDQAALAAPRTTGGPDVPFDTDGQPGWDADPTDPGDWRDVAPVRESTWHGTRRSHHHHRHWP